MSRTNLSWNSGGRGKSKRPSPLTIAHLERRFRTEADEARVASPPGLSRRTMAVLQDIELGGGVVRSPFLRPKISLASMSLVASLVMAIIIGSVVSTKEPTSPRLVFSKAVTMPTSHSLQADAWASVQAISLRSGIELDQNAFSNTLLEEMKALWLDASSAADAMLTSVPIKALRKTNTIENSS